jgi:hypothetical protein
MAIIRRNIQPVQVTADYSPLASALKVGGHFLEKYPELRRQNELMKDNTQYKQQAYENLQNVFGVIKDDPNTRSEYMRIHGLENATPEEVDSHIDTALERNNPDNFSRQVTSEQYLKNAMKQNSWLSDLSASKDGTLDAMGRIRSKVKTFGDAGKQIGTDLQNTMNQHRYRGAGSKINEANQKGSYINSEGKNVPIKNKFDYNDFIDTLGLSAEERAKVPNYEAGLTTATKRGEEAEFNLAIAPLREALDAFNGAGYTVGDETYSSSNTSLLEFKDILFDSINLKDKEQREVADEYYDSYVQDKSLDAKDLATKLKNALATRTKRDADSRAKQKQVDTILNNINDDYDRALSNVIAKMKVDDISDSDKGVLVSREKQIKGVSNELKKLRSDFVSGKIPVDKIDEIVDDIIAKYQNTFGVDTQKKPGLFSFDSNENMAKRHAKDIKGTSDSEGNVFDVDGNQLGYYEDKTYIEGPREAAAITTPQGDIVTETATQAPAPSLRPNAPTAQTAEAETVKEDMPAPKTKAEYDAIPPGTIYLDIDGKVKTKGNN